MIDHSPTFPPDARFQLYVRLLHKLILDNCSKSEKLCFYQTRVKKRLRLAFIHDLVSSKFTYWDYEHAIHSKPEDRRLFVYISKACALGFEIFHRYKKGGEHINSDFVESYQTAIKKIFTLLCMKLNSQTELSNMKINDILSFSMECTLYLEIKFSCRKRVMQQCINIQCDSAKKIGNAGLYIFKIFCYNPNHMIDDALFPINCFFLGGGGW